MESKLVAGGGGKADAANVSSTFPFSPFVLTFMGGAKEGQFHFIPE